MKDLRVIKARVVLPVNSIAMRKEFYPPSLLIAGSDFDKAESVEMNGRTVTEFVVSSPELILARVPDVLLDQRLTSLKVYSTVAIARRDALIEFGLTRPMATVQGIDRLVQSWLLIFMTTPGSDLFVPKSGGGAKALIGKSTDRGHRSVATDVALSINRTKNELMSAQSQYLSLIHI